MSVPLIRPATVDGLFLWVMHRFAEEFEEHAVVKGGLALRLLDCPRSTTDIDYVFVPYTSKKEILEQFAAVLDEIDGAEVDIKLHSKMIRASLKVDDASIQIEASVETSCPSEAVPTASLALDVGQPSRLVRVMAMDHALAHKLAAWNERRLLRDLYDVYFLVVRQGARPEMATLESRLGRVQSRLPQLKKRRSMTVDDLRRELLEAADQIDDTAIRNELAPVLPPDEVEGLRRRLRSAVVRAAEFLSSSE